MTFENLVDWHKTTVPIGFQILIQVELVEAKNAKSIEQVIS